MLEKRWGMSMYPCIHYHSLTFSLHTLPQSLGMPRVSRAGKMLSDSSSTNLAGRLCCLAVKFQGQVHLTSQAVKICRCQYLSVNRANRVFISFWFTIESFFRTFVPIGLVEHKKINPGAIPNSLEFYVLLQCFKHTQSCWIVRFYYTNSSSHVIFAMTSCAHCHTIIHIQACNGSAQW